MNDDKGHWINRCEYNVLDARFGYYITCSVCQSRIKKQIGAKLPDRCPHCHTPMEVVDSGKRT